MLAWVVGVRILPGLAALAAIASTLACESPPPFSFPGRSLTQSPTTPTPPMGQGPLIGVRRVEGVLHNSLGAVVPGARIETNRGLVEFTDANGAFAFPEVAIPDGLVHLMISKENYHTMYDKLILGSQAPQPVIVNDIVLLLAKLVLPVDGVLTLTLLPGDPTPYVGTIYYSDICHQCIDIEFTTPADADLVVTLDGGTFTDLQIWALGGLIVGQPETSSRRVLTLPRGRSGPLKVGAVSRSISQPVMVTLATASRP